MFRWLLPIGAFLGTVFAGTGPSALYNALNGQTFNPPGYTIVMYQSCMQNQNAGNSCGSFTTFESSNGVYTSQVYGPAAASGNCARTFRLSFACGSTVAMSGVNENPICVYAATLTHPYVCGLDMTVGNEAASVSPTTPPLTVTASPTYTGTLTPTITASINSSATSTPLFVITAYPTTTATMTLTATGTPLFMITAWPSSSPMNVSATSTPLYYMTAYPSYNPSNGSGLLGGLIASVPSSVATILGAVAVGIVGIGALGYGINYLRNGGTLKGLFQLAKSKAGSIQQFTNEVPLPDSMKKSLHQAETLAKDPRAQMAMQAIEDPHAALQRATSGLELPSRLTSSLGLSPQSFPPQATSISHHPAYSSTPFEPPTDLHSVVSAVNQVASPVEPLVSQTATIEVSAEHIDAIQAYLASRGAPPAAP